MYPKSSIVPPGGFHYVERHAGAEIRLTGDSVDNLALIIERYRLNNGIPLGDPKQDIVNYICYHWPHFCNNTSGQLAEGHRLPAAHGLALRVSSWVTRLWNIGSANFVAPEAAVARAAVCRDCPMNRDFRAGGCSSCVKGVDRLAFLWLANRFVPDLALWHSLRGCRADGAHLQAAVFAAKTPPPTDAERFQFDARCWRKNAL